MSISHTLLPRPIISRRDRRVGDPLPHRPQIGGDMFAAELGHNVANHALVSGEFSIKVEHLKRMLGHGAS